MTIREILDAHGFQLSRHYAEHPTGLTIRWDAEPRVICYVGESGSMLRLPGCRTVGDLRALLRMLGDEPHPILGAADILRTLNDD